MSHDANAKIAEMEVSLVVIRADGTREDLGVVAYYHKNPIKRWIHKIKLMKGGH